MQNGRQLMEQVERLLSVRVRPQFALDFIQAVSRVPKGKVASINQLNVQYTQPLVADSAKA
jgi:hypothetical protein